MTKTILLLLLFACDIPSQEDIRAEVDRAADVVDRRIASGTALIVAACAEAATAFSDCEGERTGVAEDLATVVLWRLGCVFADDRWDCSNSAFCGVTPTP
jgi:hypothetical protein